MFRKRFLPVFTHGSSGVISLGLNYSKGCNFVSFLSSSETWCGETAWASMGLGSGICSFFKGMALGLRAENSLHRV